MDNVISLCEYRKQKAFQKALIDKDGAFEKGFKSGAFGEECKCPFEMGNELREPWYKGFQAGRACVY